MALGAGKWRRREADFKDTGNTQFRVVKGTVQMLLSSPPSANCKKGQRSLAAQVPPFNPRSLLQFSTV